MLALLANLFGRRQSRFGAFRNRTGNFARSIGPRRGGIGLGALASIAAPFIINRMRQRRAQRAF